MNSSRGISCNFRHQGCSPLPRLTLSAREHQCLLSTCVSYVGRRLLCNWLAVLVQLDHQHLARARCGRAMRVKVRKIGLLCQIGHVIESAALTIWRVTQQARSIQMQMAIRY